MEFDQYAKDYVVAVDDAAGISVEQLAGEKARLILEVIGASSEDTQHLPCWISAAASDFSIASSNRMPAR
jgi:hypothetical protein